MHEGEVVTSTQRDHGRDRHLTVEHKVEHRARQLRHRAQLDDAAVQRVRDFLTERLLAVGVQLTHRAHDLRVLHLDVFDRVSEEQFEFEDEGAEVSEEQNQLRKLLNMSVKEIELSVRAANCLNNANITTVGELAMKSEQEMLKYRNFGKKSLNEIKDKLEDLGLSLGMKFDERLIDLKKEI